MKKKMKPILFILLLLILYVYITSVTMLPNHIVIFEGENLSIHTLMGVKVKTINSSNIENSMDDVLQTAATLTKTNTNKVGQMNLSLNLFDKIPIKQIDVDVINKTRVIPMGNAIGLKLYTKGVMVVGMSEIQGEDKTNLKPYEGVGIEEGDMIIEVNDEKINSTNELIDRVNKSKGNKLKLRYIRDNKTLETSMIPVKVSENEYKLGLWVRDAAARSWNCNIL